MPGSGTSEWHPFDYFAIPTVPALKQQQDTIATLTQLARLGIPASRLKIVFNPVEDGVRVDEAFDTLLAFIEGNPVTQTSVQCKLGTNEVYERVKGTGRDLTELASDKTDYKALIAKAQSTADKLALAQKLATRRLASASCPSSTRALRRSSSARWMPGRTMSRIATVREAMIAEMIGDITELLDHRRPSRRR